MSSFKGSNFVSVFTLVLVDTTPPDIKHCPSSIHTTTELGSPGAPVSWTIPSASDYSGAVVSLSSHEPGDIFPAGLTNITYHFEDESGNMAECNFTVLVEYGKYDVCIFIHIFEMYMYIYSHICSHITI